MVENDHLVPQSLRMAETRTTAASGAILSEPAQQTETAQPPVLDDLERAIRSNATGRPNVKSPEHRSIPAQGDLCSKTEPHVK